MAVSDMVLNELCKVPAGELGGYENATSTVLKYVDLKKIAFVGTNKTHLIFTDGTKLSFSKGEGVTAMYAKFSHVEIPLIAHPNIKSDNVSKNLDWRINENRECELQLTETTYVENDAGYGYILPGKYVYPL